MTTQPDLIASLRGRDLIEQVTHDETLEAHLNAESRRIYAGFDPTADSLHIGSLLPLLALRRVQMAGHQPILVVGGATGLIGDPSGKTQERTLNTADTVAEWTNCLARQASRFLDLEAGPAQAIVVNNYDWLSQYDLTSYLRDIGKHFSVNAMLQRDAVKDRLGREGVGISYTEFSYGILQAMDFMTLHREHGCTVQIGGSDQWGNIVSGIDLTRRLSQAEVFGFTLPLVTKSDGTKFGKTETGTIWLDADKTSPYAFYQFWINATDDDVTPWLKYFSFDDMDAITTLVSEHAEAPHKRLAQQHLADAVTRIVHGEDGLSAAKRVTEALFTGDVRQLSETDLEGLAKGGLSCVNASAGMSLVDALIEAGLAPSKRQAREFVTNQAVSVNGEKVTDVDAVLGASQALAGRYFVLRRGKKHNAMVVLG